MSDDGEAGEFGQLGGRFGPETLEGPLDELARAFDEVAQTPEFYVVGHCDYRAVTATRRSRPSVHPPERKVSSSALESSHTVALAEALVDEHDTIVVNLSVRVDEEVEQAAELFDLSRETPASLQRGTNLTCLEYMIYHWA